MIFNNNRSKSFKIIEPKRIHHAQEIPVSLSNQQIPILSSREGYRSKSYIPLNFFEKLTNIKNLNNCNLEEPQLNKESKQKKQRSRNLSDTESSYINETTSESGISDLEMNEKCTCCPYGYHIDVDFVSFVNNFDEKNLNKQMIKKQQKNNTNLQKSMEYVIDEVERLKQMNELTTKVPDAMNYSNNLYRKPRRQSQIQVSNNLKKTIKQIDQFICHNEKSLCFYSQDFCSDKSNRIENKSINSDQMRNNLHYLSNSSLPSDNSFLKPSHSFNVNHLELGNTPRRSYSSCAEHILNSSSSKKIKSDPIFRRRCLSNRNSPVRTNFSTQNLPFRQIYDARRSYSGNRRSQSESPIEKQLFKREIKINIARPNKTKHNDEKELKRETIFENSRYQELHVTRPITNSISLDPSEAQEEVLLNLFSCNNSSSLSSDSSESLVEIEQNLKINETYDKKESIIENKSDIKCQNNNILLEKRLIELEKKLMKIPELEIKNSILIEEKKLLLKQLLNRNKIFSQPHQTNEPAKVYRSIGCDSQENSKKDVGISVKSNTRDVGLLVDEPSVKIAEMEILITNLKHKLKEQTMIFEQSQQKPTTRDVAVMHVVDKVEEPPKPKPELRDVAIHHSTIDENKIIVEKQTEIISDYIKEIEKLQVENCHLSASLQELVKKHSKHVVTRGTFAPEQPILYSVGVNTKKATTRDVQVMYMPKSRDVCLSTDQFIHTRDVNLECNIENNETKIQLEELNFIKKKYELIVQENLKNLKSYRDVNILCKLDQKEYRDVSLGCNMFEKKNFRDVSLKCDMDKELKMYRDVGVQLDQKPEQKDANIYVNFRENISRPIMKDSYAMTDVNNTEKQLLKELEKSKITEVKKNAFVSVDFNTRLTDNLIKNSFSCMEEIKTSNKQINTDYKSTREIPIGNSLIYLNKSCQTLSYVNEHESQQHQVREIELEMDKLKALNENLKLQMISMNEQFKSEKYQKKDNDLKVDLNSNDYKNSTSVSTITANVNCSLDSNISQIKTSSFETDITKIKRQSEFERHRILKTDKNKQIVENKIKISESVSNRSGEKTTEMVSWENKSEILFDLNEIKLPIKNEALRGDYKVLDNQFSSDNKIRNTKNGTLLNKEIVEENKLIENKNPKSILKQAAVISSSKINKYTGKALTFGENEILETEIDNENDEVIDKNLESEYFEVKKNKNEKLNVLDEEQINLSKQSENVRTFELELELHIACAILNDSLYEPLKADKNKVAKAINLIQQDWFKLAAQKDSNPLLVEEHLNAFYSRFSNLLLERIVNMADLNNNTALHYSVSTGNFEIVNLLLDTKVCDVNAQNKAGYTSIMLAAVVPIKDDFERMTLKRLFSEGNVNIKSTDSGQTALMLAVRHGNKDTVALLLESSADCNVQDKEGSTALMAACEHGHIDIVRLLLDNTNCDPDIKDNDGETAFEIAKNKNRNDIIVLLYAHSTKLRSHHPAIQFSKTRPRIGSAGSSKK